MFICHIILHPWHIHIVYFWLACMIPEIYYIPSVFHPSFSVIQWLYLSLKSNETWLWFDKDYILFYATSNSSIILPVVFMMTSSNVNILQVTDLLCGEFTSHRRIPRTKAIDAELWCFLSSASQPTVEQTVETPHNDVIVMLNQIPKCFDWYVLTGMSLINNMLLNTCM